MKVNVIGKGYIRQLNAALPVYGVDVDKATTNQLLGYRNLAVYMADRPVRITRANIDAVFNVTKPAVRIQNDLPKTAAVHAAVAQPVVEEKVVEEVKPVEIEQVETPVEMTAEVEAEPIEETVEAVETPVEEEAVIEEAVEEVASEENLAIESHAEGFPNNSQDETTEETSEEKPVYSKKHKKNRK